MPAAVAEQLQLLAVVLLDGAAVADADQDGVRQPLPHQLVEHQLQTLVQRRGRLVQEHRLGPGQQDARECHALLLAGREHLGPVLHLVQPIDQMWQRDGGQHVAQLRVGDVVGAVRIGDDGAQITQRHVGQLRQEHRGALAAGPPQRPGAERPQLGQAAQQRGLAAARRSGDHQAVARVQGDVEWLDQLAPVRCAHRDPPHLDAAAVAVLATQRRQFAALLVGDDEAVQADDGRAVAGEVVVGVAEERQPGQDLPERARGLRQLPQGDLSAVEAGELHDVGDEFLGLGDAEVPAEEFGHPVDVALVVVDDRREAAA